MNVAQDFFSEVLKQNYELDFNETIAQFAEEKDLAKFRMREPLNDTELENLKKLANAHPLGAILSAIAYMEKSLHIFSLKIIEGEESLQGLPSRITTSAKSLEQLGIDVPNELQVKLNEARNLRNLAAHGREDPSISSAIKVISTVEEFERFLTQVNLVQAREKALEVRTSRPGVSIFLG